jgi:hypothetical protein
LRSHYGASAEESSGREPTTIGKGRQVRHPAHHTTGGSLQQSERPPGSTAKSAMPPRHTIRRGGAQTRPCELKTATPAERRPRDHPTPYGPLPCHPGVRITRPEGPRGPSHATLTPRGEFYTTQRPATPVGTPTTRILQHEVTLTVRRYPERVQSTKAGGSLEK